MKKNLYFAIFMSILLLISACGSDLTSQTPLDNSSAIATIVAATLSAIPSETSAPKLVATAMPTQTSFPTADEWIWQNISLYALRLKLPSSWNISEINRRLESTSNGYPTPEHDCAEYNISDPSGTIQIFIKPECVFFSAVPDNCPDDIVLMSRDSENIVRYDQLIEDETIGRFYDGSSTTYKYYDIGYPNWQGQVVMACYEPFSIAVNNGKDISFLQIEFRYMGNDTTPNQVLTTVDKIVLSITKQ